MSNGQSSSGGIGGGLVPEDGFLGGSLLEEADLLGALPGLTDIIGAGGVKPPVARDSLTPLYSGCKVQALFNLLPFPSSPVQGELDLHLGRTGVHPLNSIPSSVMP